MKDQIRNGSLVLGMALAILLTLVTGALSAPAQPVAKTNIAPSSKTIVQKPSDEIKARLDKGYSLLSQGSPSTALKEFNKVLETDKHNARAMVGVAYCHGTQGNWGLACNEMEEACLYNPRNTFALINYLDASCRQGRLNRAIMVLKRLFNSNDKAAAPLSKRAAQYIVEVDYWQAQWFARRAHDLDPKAFPSSEIRPNPLRIKTNSTFSQQETPEEQLSEDQNTIPSEETRDTNGNPGLYTNTDMDFNYGSPLNNGGDYQNNPYGGFGDNSPPFSNPFSSYGGLYMNPSINGMSNIFGGINPMGPSYGNMNVPNNILNTPFDGGNLPYRSYPLGNGLNYVPPYSGPLNY